MDKAIVVILGLAGTGLGLLVGYVAYVFVDYLLSIIFGGR